MTRFGQKKNHFCGKKSVLDLVFGVLVKFVFKYIIREEVYFFEFMNWIILSS